MKNVYVILGFHAHEPNKESGNLILQDTADQDIKKAVPFENLIIKNSVLVRDTFLALIQLSKNFNIPVCLAASNEILLQLRNAVPETFTKLREAYQERAIYPIFNFAHEAHVLYLNPEEVIDEIRLNVEFFEEMADVSVSKHAGYKGIFPPECSIDGKKIDSFSQAGVDYLIAPHLKDQFINYSVTPQTDPDFSPLQFDNGIAVFSRNHAVSEGLWQVLTRLKPKWAIQEGYLLGEFPVFAEEYLSGKYLKNPLSLQEAIDEYTNILRQVVQEAPENGVICSLQKLDTMNFGEWALGIIGAAWQNIVSENSVQVHFVTPAQILKERNKNTFPRLKFDEVCWYPENRVIINFDGQYPPLGVSEYNGFKVGEKLWRKWPFIFWEPGRQLTTIFHSLFSSFGYKVTTKLKVRELMQQSLLGLELEEQFALNLRFIKRATNWVASFDPELQREVFLRAYYICKRMSDLRLDAARFQRISDETLVKLDNILEIILGQRISLLQSGIKKMEQTKMTAFPLSDALLQGAKTWQDKASFALKNAQNLNRSGKNSGELLKALAECFKDVFLSLDSIKRVIKDMPEKEFVFTEIYKQLYKSFPPKLFTTLEMLMFK